MALKQRRKRAGGKPFAKGRPKTGGRQKGVQNKATREIKDFARALFERPAYQARVRREWDKGTLPPQVQLVLLYYGFGKPKETIAHEGGDVPMRFTLTLDNRKQLGA